MKERPILFSGPMVRAILDGSKTQTRRVMKQQPVFDGNFWTLGGAGWSHGMSRVPVMPCHSLATRSPCGMPRDRLWVRENWMDLTGTGIEPVTGSSSPYAYGADTPPGSYGDQCRKDYGLKWRPSIHMPRAVSRITLEVTGVRVERLQDISEQDAIAEGIGKTAAGFWSTYGRSGVDGTYSPRSSFHCLWDSVNSAESWDANPWVWVVEFKRVSEAA